MPDNKKPARPRKQKGKVTRKAARLTEKQLRFVERYMVCANASQAAKEAGYSEQTASMQGYQLLQKTLVAEEIRRRQEARAKALEITQARVLQEIAMLAYSDIGDVCRWTEGGHLHITPTEEMLPQHRRAIESIKRTEKQAGEMTIVECEVKMHSKVQTLKLLAKHMGLEAPTRHQLADGDGKPVPIADVAREMFGIDVKKGNDDGE